MGQAAPVEVTRIETADEDVARQFLSDAYGDNQLRVTAPVVEDHVLSIERFDAPRVNFSDVEIPSDVEMTVSGQEGEVLVATIQEGSASIDHRGWHGEGATELGPGDVTLSNAPSAEWVHHIRPLRNTTVGVSEELLQDVAGVKMTGSVADLVTATTPRPGGANLWATVSGYVKLLVSDPKMSREPLLLGPAERLLGAALLSIFPNKLVEEQWRGDHLGGSELLRRAVAFIESNPQADISLGEIAEAAYASRRAVQTAFRKHLDTTPMAYLRKVRLQHARDELEATRGNGETVSSVAMKWGFRNPGRFAGHYRREFGESPSDTLRR